MKKVVYIFGLFTVLAVVASCEKEEVRPVSTEDSYSCESTNHNKSSQKEGDIVPSNRNGADGDDLNTSGGITDPNNDEDYDGIVDPDKDEDFDKEGKGK